MVLVSSILTFNRLLYGDSDCRVRALALQASKVAQLEERERAELAWIRRVAVYEAGRGGQLAAYETIAVPKLVQ